MNETRIKRTPTVRDLVRKTIGSGTRSHHARAAMLTMALGVSATVSAAPAAQDAVQPPPPAPVVHQATPKHHWYQVGKASWYGAAFRGKRTASGERFNPNLLTCAHRSLPLGSWIRVTNLSNHKSTYVRVTDRGPFVKNVVLDLSAAAARKLGFDSLAKVRIDQVSPNDPGVVELQKLASLELPSRDEVVGGQ